MKNMMRKIRTVKYILKNSLLNVIRNKMMLIASLIIMIATMFIFGAFYVLSKNVNYQIDNIIKNEFEISIHLDPSIDDKKALYFENILKKDKRIDRYIKISKAQALEEYKKTLPEEEAKFILEDMQEDFLPISFNIKLKDSRDSSAVIKDLLKISINDLDNAQGDNGEENPNGTTSPDPQNTMNPTATASAGGSPQNTPAADKTSTPALNGTQPQDVNPDESESRDAVWEYSEVESTIKSLKTFQRTIGIIFSIILGLLTFYSIIVISNTVMLTVIARKREISIMRNIGATSAYIRGPFIIEGCIIGIVGAIIAFFIVEFAYNSLSAAITRELSGINLFKVELLDYKLFSTELMIYFILLSAFIGGIGALLSVNKNIKS